MLWRLDQDGALGTQGCVHFCPKSLEITEKNLKILKNKGKQKMMRNPWKKTNEDRIMEKNLA